MTAQAGLEAARNSLRTLDDTRENPRMQPTACYPRQLPFDAFVGSPALPGNREGPWSSITTAPTARSYSSPAS